MGLSQALQQYANPEKAKLLQRFFKTGKGEYGEGDIFLGIMVPQSRAIVKEFADIPLEQVEKHLQSKFHEERLVALLILVEKYKTGNKNEIVDFYLKHKRYVNSWDLVDLTAPRILGTYLIDKDKKVLYELANSNNLWDRRIAIISTLAFIKDNKFEETFAISNILMKDKHDLIHKAVGWMLREVGKKDELELRKFLKNRYRIMPRTMLRYSIERFPDKVRKAYLEGRIR